MKTHSLNDNPPQNTLNEHVRFVIVHEIILQFNVILIFNNPVGGNCNNCSFPHHLPLNHVVVVHLRLVLLRALHPAATDEEYEAPDACSQCEATQERDDHRAYPASAGTGLYGGGAEEVGYHWCRRGAFGADFVVPAALPPSRTDTGKLAFTIHTLRDATALHKLTLIGFCADRVLSSALPPFRALAEIGFDAVDAL